MATLTPFLQESIEWLIEEARADEQLVREGRPEFARAAAIKRELADEIRSGQYVPANDDELEDELWGRQAI